MESSFTGAQPTSAQAAGSGAEAVEIVYYTDPLCCWSWAFEPHWQRLRHDYGGTFRYRYCMGGLIPSWNNYSDSVTSVSRPAQMGPVWMEAAHTTGVPINTRIWIENPPASSYLPCIAFKCAEAQGPAAAESYLWRMREAVMVQGRNIALQSVLVELAAEMAAQERGSLDAARFSADLVGDSALEAFRRDLQEVQYRGINRFPTLVFRRHDRPSLITTGFCPYDHLQELMKKLLE
ncbi:DsbA family protein [Paraflavisolibacter sp. H34]|uniref:DsbA family protein n=1 Tax=Huijunlia imazamoxiresistens TaxID=3127457 RepID=UPI00301B23A7